MENLSTQPIQATQSLPQNPPIQPVIIPEKPKTNFAMIGLTVLACLIVFGFGGYYLGKLPTKSVPNLPSPSPSTFTNNDQTSNWNNYTNTKFSYSLKYPADWSAKSVEPGPADLPINTTSRGIVIYPSNYSSSATAKALVQIETDGLENTAFSGFDDWLNSIHQSFFKTTLTTQDGLAGLSGETSIGSYDGYGYPAEIKRYALKSLDGKTYYTITITLEQNSQSKQTAEQIISTIKFLTQAVTENDWESYTNPSALYEIQYPKGWRVVPYNIGEGYGPKEIAEDVLWGINFYEKKDYSLDQVANEFGKQFSDRKQSKNSILVNKIPAVKIVTTTPSMADWYLESIVIERGDSYIVISNGAINNTNLQKMKGVPAGTTFEKFYNSFHFVN